MWYWVIAGFGFLFALRAVRSRSDESRTTLSLHSLWREALDLFVSLLFLVTLYDVALAWGSIAGEVREFGFLILWVAAYLTGRYQKKPDLFFVSLSALAYTVVAVYSQWVIQASLVLALAFGIFVFQFAFKGLKYALLFSRVPETFKGWPALCLIAFCVSVVLSGFAMLLF